MGDLCSSRFLSPVVRGGYFFSVKVVSRPFRLTRRVGIVEMRTRSDEVQQVVHGGRVVAQTASGAIEFKPSDLGIQTGHDDVPPEVGVAPGDPPPASALVPDRVRRRAPCVILRHFANVESVGKLDQLGRAVSILEC